MKDWEMQEEGSKTTLDTVTISDLARNLAVTPLLIANVLSKFGYGNLKANDRITAVLAFDVQRAVERERLGVYLDKAINNLGQRTNQPKNETPEADALQNSWFGAGGPIMEPALWARAALVLCRNLERTIAWLKQGDNAISNSYLRIRNMLGAWDTNYGGENRFKVTEDKLKNLLQDLKNSHARNEHLEKLLTAEENKNKTLETALRNEQDAHLETGNTLGIKCQELFEQLSALQKQQIWEFGEEEIPSFRETDKPHELEERVTASRCSALVKMITDALAERKKDHLRIQALEKVRDRAWTERNQLVAALSKMFPAWMAVTDIPGWDPKWHLCVYIILPTGQVSWHIRDEHKQYFNHPRMLNADWDGHDTVEKYRRLNALKSNFWRN